MSKRRRRGQNEGSIFQWKDGRWCAVLSLGWENGRRKRKSLYAETAAEVQQLALKARADHSHGLKIDAKQTTLGAFLDDWLATIRSSVRTRTFEKYEETIRKHLKPQLQAIKIAKLTPQDVQSVLESKLTAGLHPRTVQAYAPC